MCVQFTCLGYQIWINTIYTIELRLGDSVTTIPATSNELELRAQLASLQAQLDALHCSKNADEEKPPAPVRRIPVSLHLDNAIFHDNQLGEESQLAEAPFPEAPQMPEPKAIEPQAAMEAEAPTSQPNTALPPKQPEFPKDDASSAEQPHHDLPQGAALVGEPKAELPKQPDLPKDDALVGEPKAELPKQLDLPKDDAAAEQPKGDLPQDDAPLAEEPKADLPPKQPDLLGGGQPKVPPKQPDLPKDDAHLAEEPRADLPPMVPDLPAGGAVPEPKAELPPKQPDLPKDAAPLAEQPKADPKQPDLPKDAAPLAEQPKADLPPKQPDLPDQPIVPCSEAATEKYEAAALMVPAKVIQPVAQPAALMVSDKVIQPVAQPNQPDAAAQDRKVMELQKQLREMEDRLIAMQAKPSTSAQSSSSKGDDAHHVPLAETLDGEPLGEGDLDADLAALINSTSSPAGHAPGAPEAPQAQQESGEAITFTTHRVEGMRMNRFMESAEGAKYPHMMKLFKGTNAEKRQLLKHWVQNGGDKSHAKDIEASVVLSKSSATEVKGRMECLSVLEMKRRGWPRNKILACVQKGGGIKDEHCPDDPLLTSYWSITERSKTDTETTRVDGQVRVGCEASDAIAAVSTNAIMGRLLRPADPCGLAGVPGTMSEDHLKAIQASIGAVD